MPKRYESQDPGPRFVIMGLPRSGTTYLMTLLNAHGAVFCSGEQFNPHGIIGIGGDANRSLPAVTRRDARPARFLEAFFDAHPETERRRRVGFKFMIGHNIWALNAILKDPGLTLLYVHRDNKLAQVSSWIKAKQTRKWAQDRPDDHVTRKIKSKPQNISQHWHEFATHDRLFAHLFHSLPHRRMAIEYREMFVPGFNADLCDFLGLPPDPAMRSPLVKQGANAILERFENPKPIRDYFTKIGRAEWLEPEL